MPERGQQPKRPRREAAGQGRGNGGQPNNTVQRLLCAHDSAIEKLKAALVIFLFVPKAMNDEVEKGIDKLMGGEQPILTAEAEVKTALTALVAVVQAGRADHIVSDITLRIAQSRTADQSPYEITIASTKEGMSFRTALFGITQTGAPQTNSREVALKSWEVRPYRPNRRGALVRELTGGN
ncbi:unnamed protein product [Symbiodinium sp. CCMP2592]|nr:unnamed protein product [Symbiodinium sp. CCMP2592]